MTDDQRKQDNLTPEERSRIAKLGGQAQQDMSDLGEKGGQADQKSGDASELTDEERSTGGQS